MKNNKQTQYLKILKTDQKLINKLINSNTENDPSLIKNIEKILIEKRGVVFSEIKPKQPVIALMSGGLDTTVVIGILLEVFKVDVYPLFIDRGLPHSSQIKKSMDYFSEYFKKKYPKQFHKPFMINLSIPPKEIKNEIIAAENDIIHGKKRKGVPLQPSLYAHYAFLYAKYLEEKINVKIRTIIGAWIPSNSEWYSYESITSLRSIMLNLCVLDNDFDWHFTSLPMEKNLGFYFDKDVLVKIGIEMGIPIEKTWTCFAGNLYQCGICPPCTNRREAHDKLKLFDKTIYQNSISFYPGVFLKIKIFLKSIKHNFFKKI